MKKKKLNVYNNITHFRKAQEHNNNVNNIKDIEELMERIKQSDAKLNDIQHQLKDARKMVKNNNNY